MKKFSEMEYRRPDGESMIEKSKQSAGRMHNAASYPEARQIFLELETELARMETMATVASIRNTVDTRDEFYEGEMAYFYEMEPRIDVAQKAFSEALLNSPFLEEFEQEFGELYFKNMRGRIRLTDEKNVELQIKESRLTQQYAKASAVASTTFRGQEVNFYGLLKQMQSTDRQTRKEAFEAWAGLYESISGELDDIYSRLIEIRCQMAENLGFSDYVEMKYLSRRRYDYSREDAANFRRQIVEEVTPICQRLFEEQKSRLGIDALHYYDEALVFPEGNAVPEGTPAELLDKAQQMYRELSEQTGEFFDFMREYELFDLETKPGKRQGGYCTFLPDEKAPFIFSNFNGTSADVDVLTHEAGHAFEAYTASRRFPLTEQVFSTSEIDEIHSMSMEFFTYPWMHLFFGENEGKYRYKHLSESLEAVPYMACVDEFQHRVYEQKLTDPIKRRHTWRELEQKYMPWRDYDGNAFLEQGGFWMQKQHIFLYPFYYIDYALAQMGAFEYLSRMQKDRKAAWQDYYRLCCAGGSRGYFELLAIGGLSNPFVSGTVGKIMEAVKEELRIREIL